MTLTEQWKKGELELGKYYIKTIYGGVVEDTHIRTKVGCVWSNYQNDEIIEVLAPVPSYEEWQELSKQRNQLIRDVKDLAYIQEENTQLRKWCEEFNALDVAKENQQLKELLLDCQQSFRGIRVQIEEFEYSMARKTAQIAIDEIDNAIGEKR